MDVSLSELFPGIYNFTPGRRILSMRQVKTAALAANETALVAHAEACITHDQHTLVLDAQWNARTTTTIGNPELRDVDIILDPLVTSLRDTIDGQVRGSKPGDALAELGAQLLIVLFPQGVSAVTHATYADEAAEVERIIVEIKKPEWGAVVVGFGLARIVERMQEVILKYRQLLEAPAPAGLKFSDVKAARAQGQSLLLQTLAMVLAKYPSDSEADKAGREALMGPILRQNEAIGQYLKSRRTVPDVNPDTGEEAITP
ncbi:MAG: hypothetical protein IPM54_08840 [Polyangiaceae bacterium]|nr:hypothetical protein [Polyangiaceae bacterium]